MHFQCMSEFLLQELLLLVPVLQVNELPEGTVVGTEKLSIDVHLQNQLLWARRDPSIKEATEAIDRFGRRLGKA